MIFSNDYVNGSKSSMIKIVSNPTINNQNSLTPSKKKSLIRSKIDQRLSKETNLLNKTPFKEKILSIFTQFLRSNENLLKNTDIFQTGVGFFDAIKNLIGHFF
ncbi:hypothetical protein BpHYR1_005829 [Brachionus plicatilis]|uniref:Uncharacterized protein n=1 Tax=Brachionus plicatilis TaxID=10195 RepID=A0A3M7Q196_BRAPC|nr:hypothetical protein BpHYR1_005829 [Brachionus plicatilis]